MAHQHSHKQAHDHAHGEGDCGGHSHTHPIMSRLDAAEAETEVRTCRDRIAAETQQAPTSFVSLVERFVSSGSARA